MWYYDDTLYTLYSLYTLYTLVPYPGFIHWYIYSYICIHAHVPCIIMDVSTASAASPAHTSIQKGGGASRRLHKGRGGASRRPPLCGFLSGWMCVGWWSSRCDGNIHKYAWNMRMYAYITIYSIMSTKIQALGSLKTPFDIVFDTLFNRGYHPIQPLQNVRFYKYGHNWGVGSQICPKCSHLWKWS